MARTPARPWTAKDVQWVIKNYGRLTKRQIATALGRTYVAVHNQIERQRQAGKMPYGKGHRNVDDWIARNGETLRYYHGRGYSDKDIAVAMGHGLNKTFIKVCRVRMDLHPNPMSTDRNRAKSRKTAVVNQVSRLRSALAAEAMGWSGYKGVEARIMDYLYRHGPQKSIDLARALGYQSRQAVSDQLTAMARRGMVVRNKWLWSVTPGVEPLTEYVDPLGDD